MQKYHRFDEEAAYRETFKGVVWRDDKAYMDGPRGLVPVTLGAVSRHCRERDDAYNQGYHDLDMVLQHLREDAYWNAIGIIEGLKADGYGSLIPSTPFDDDDRLAPPPEELDLVF